jgi:hypothetical protein
MRRGQPIGYWHHDAVTMRAASGILKRSTNLRARANALRTIARLERKYPDIDVRDLASQFVQTFLGRGHGISP